MKLDVLGLPIYQHCIELKRVSIAPEGFFGFTSHTGNWADTHIIHSLVVKDLSPMNTNLNDLKKTWAEAQEVLHQQHNDMSESDFKHTVLQQLRQTQEEINMVEMTTLADSKEVKQGLKLVSLLEVLLGNLFNQFRAKMSDKDIQIEDRMKLIGADPSLNENLENNLQQIRQAISILKSMPQQSDAPIVTKISELIQEINSLKKDLSFFKNAVSSSQQSFNNIVTKLASYYEKAEEPSTSNNSSSWWTYFMIALVTAPLGGVLTHFCKPKPKKYDDDTW